MTVSLNDLKIGMRLAENVTNSIGGILFKAEETLTGKHLKAFKAWGITEVKIGDVEGLNLQEKSPQVIDEKFKEKGDWLFQKTDKDDPIIQELYRLAIEKFAERKEGI